MSKINKILKKIFISLFLFFILIIILSNLIIILNAQGKIFSEPKKILTKNNIVLVLGTSYSSLSGKENIFYKNRINAALKLYQANKVDKFILSGHQDWSYNEAEKMKKDLISGGVSENIIIKDERGDRTINSILNLKNNLNEYNNIIIISQKFHIERALLIAQFFGIEATGFIAYSPSFEYGAKTYAREIVARIKVFLDFFVY